MIKENLAWVGLLLLSLVMIVAGFQGAIGKMLACLLVPSQVVENG